MGYLAEIGVIVNDIIAVAHNQNIGGFGIFHADFIRLFDKQPPLGRSAVARHLHKIGLKAFNVVEISFNFADILGTLRLCGAACQHQCRG